MTKGGRLVESELIASSERRFDTYFYRSASLPENLRLCPDDSKGESSAGAWLGSERQVV